MKNRIDTDIVIVGSGCAGLYCALHLPADKRVLIITKKEADKSDSYLAQGGICVLKEESDFDSFYNDTVKAGHLENDPHSVELMIRSSQNVIKDLISYGVEFQKDENGRPVYTKEGGHSSGRILYHKDITGREITSRLYEQVKRRINISIWERTILCDLLVQDNLCQGVLAGDENGKLLEIYAEVTILATGGIGGLFQHSTNYRHLTGDGIAVALKHGVELKDEHYIQIHPTTFYTTQEQTRSFLLSESLRGEGARLYDRNGKRFVSELLPRDLLTKAILLQMEKDESKFVWEDLTEIGEKKLKQHFPNIMEYCEKMGYDVTKEWIPVVPAQHYYMGGIRVDYESRTSMEALYAIGETACNGVHGKNRLASNSLLEGLVFAKRAALDITAQRRYTLKTIHRFHTSEFKSEYIDLNKLEQRNKQLVLEAINKSSLMKQTQMNQLIEMRKNND